MGAVVRETAAECLLLGAQAAAFNWKWYEQARPELWATGALPPFLLDGYWVTTFAQCTATLIAAL